MHWLLLAVTAGVLAAGPAGAQTIVNTGSLAFGSFLAGSGGTVAVSAGGGRSKSGGVIFLNQGESGAAAQFTVTGTPSAVYAITLPVDNFVTLSDGSHTMAVNSFVSNPSGTGTLSGGGSQILSVGATLIVNNSQASGSYSGSFDVTVNYQ